MASSGLLLFLGCLASALLAGATKVHHHEFIVQETPVKRLCEEHNIITVNGQFPGPTLEVREGDTLVVNVVNQAQYNVTIHWHGIRQFRTGWADGPEFVTQCPIKPGGSYKYRFTIEGQEGTLWWHAHSSWLRATVYGALIIRPREDKPYPFDKPAREVPILLGEWWNANPVEVIREAQRTGGAPNVSDAFTVNGQPGDLYNCSRQDTTAISVKPGETALLRFINSALNHELFVSIASHKMTVVGVDASYTKPFVTSVLMIAPGQTTDVLVTMDQAPTRYYDMPGVYTTDFPANPPVQFDYTAQNVSQSLWQPIPATKLYKLRFGSVVQVVLQDTSIVTPENHPIHLHGYDFYILAEGFGNYDAEKDAAKFNLENPPQRNTVAVPVNGWAVIRFRADNPGVWLMHCHLDVHITWGLAMAFLVEDGYGELQSLEAPPVDLPMC
ncbi:unnamed protein product [Triticum turgidum subsp. durum]|uniref:laccase n=1 Tax=Triticum turgidum subsp. durum TaxID=4567 RepID=A0A9R1QPT6_TRITD|nr:unnamed protein product [Triticum turgidum subsp. durum]